MRKFAKVLLGIALSAFFLYLFARNLDPSEVATAVSRASPIGLAGAILLGYFGHLALRARRWATMLRILKPRVSFYNLFSTTAIGYAISWLTPGRLGEIVRPLLLARREGIPPAASIATAGIERVIDAVTILALAAGAALAAPLWWKGAARPASIELAGLGEFEVVHLLAWAGAICLALCGLTLAAARQLLLERSRLWVFLERRERASKRAFLRRLWAILRDLAAGASFLREGAATARVAFESVLLWAVIGASIWIGLWASGVRIPPLGVFPLLALSAVGIAVPTPGGMGSVHVAFQWGLTEMYGVETNAAAAATFLYHPVIVYIPPVLFGLAFAWRDGLSLASVRGLAKRGAMLPAHQPGEGGGRGESEWSGGKADDSRGSGCPGAGPEHQGCAAEGSSTSLAGGIGEGSRP